MRSLPYKASAAHHLAPVLAAPSAVMIIYISLTELVHEQAPQFGVKQLFLFDKPDRSHQRAGEYVAPGRQQLKNVGPAARHADFIFH